MDQNKTCNLCSAKISDSGDYDIRICENCLKNDIVIKDMNEGNIKDIPSMSDKYICRECLYYLKQKNDLKVKKDWIINMNKKYGSIGKILYYKTKPIAFCQYTPKKELIRLEDLSKNSTKTDAWYILCLAVKSEYHGKDFAKLLLNEVLKDLKSRGITKVQACGMSKGDAGKFSSGYWSLYEKFEFKKISEDDEYVVGEKV